jgi:hypothetical protein
MSEPTEAPSENIAVPFQNDLIKAMEAESKRTKDPHGSICLMHMLLTYFAVQCANRALPTRKMAREAMKREIDNAFAFLDKQKLDEPADENKN